MKKIISTILIAISLFTVTACFGEPKKINETSDVIAAADIDTDRYAVIDGQEFPDIRNITVFTLIDKETRVEYMLACPTDNGGNSGMALERLVYNDGMPLIYHGPLKE